MRPVRPSATGDLPASILNPLDVSRDSMRVPLARSHLDPFCSKSCSPSGVAHTCSPDLGFYRVDRASGTLDPKRLQFCSTFCVHVLKNTVNVDSKSKLCAPNGTFELLAAVL